MDKEKNLPEKTNMDNPPRDLRDILGAQSAILAPRDISAAKGTTKKEPPKKKDSPQKMSTRPVYLGTPSPDSQDSLQKDNDFVISTSGFLPEALEKYYPRQRTNEERAIAHQIIDKYERKVMIDRTLLYLERKQLELTGYLMSAEQKSSAKTKRDKTWILSLLLVIGIIMQLCSCFIPVDWNALTLGALLIAGGYYIYCRINGKDLLPDKTQHVRDLEMRLDALKEEHDELEQEKAKIEADINELEQELKKWEE